MHYYQFNIADYRKDTVHLTPVEHYIYRELIDWYYLDETPIPRKTQQVMRRLRLGSENEPRLQNVLEEFFEEREEGWVHHRIEEDLAAYRAKAERSRVNGRKGGRPTKPRKTQQVNSGNPEETQAKGNHKPLTSNQDNPPIAPPEDDDGKEPTEDQSDQWSLPDWVNPAAWKEFEQHRKEIRKPMSDLARTKAANQLANLTHKEQQACIDKTIQNRWTGLFPERAKYGTGQDQSDGGPDSRAKRHADMLDEIAQRDIAERGGVTETLD